MIALANDPVPVPSDVWLPDISGSAVVAQHTPRAVIDDPPSVVTVPPETAEFMVMVVTVVVVTEAAPGMNERSLPLDEPSLFVATSLK